MKWILLHKKGFTLLFFAGILLFMNACSKQSLTDTNSSSTNSSSSNILLPVGRDISIPSTIGTWWKYMRIDSVFSFVYNYLYKTQKDTSFEIITVTGKTKLNNGTDVFIWEIQNITTNKKDTNYVGYSNGVFTIYDRLQTSYFNMALSVSTSKFNVDSLVTYSIGVDTSYYKTDTTVNLSTNKFEHCIYAYKIHKMWHPGQTGAGAVDYYDWFTILPGVGVITNRREVYTGGGMVATTTFYTRSLIDYKVVP